MNKHAREKYNIFRNATTGQQLVDLSVSLAVRLTSRRCLASWQHLTEVYLRLNLDMNSDIPEKKMNYSLTFCSFRCNFCFEHQKGTNVGKREFGRKLRSESWVAREFSQLSRAPRSNENQSCTRADDSWLRWQKRKHKIRRASKFR